MEQRESWWVAQSADRIVGAIEAYTFRNPHEEGRLRMWAAAGSGLYDTLIDAALGKRELASRPMVIAHPGDDADALQAMARAGFAPLRTLAHMKLDLI